MQSEDLETFLASYPAEVRADLSDLVPRYAPSKVMIAARMAYLPVRAYRFYPSSGRPVTLPKVIKDGYGVLECQTDHGARYFGCLYAYIDSHLRMVVIGTNPRDEVRMTWEVAHE